MVIMLSALQLAFISPAAVTFTLPCLIVSLLAAAPTAAMAAAATEKVLRTGSLKSRQYILYG